MTGEQRIKNVLRAVCYFLVFFLLVGFVTTCCMMLFVSTLAESLNVVLTEENVREAAKITFWNVVLISFIFTVADLIRRKITVDLPVKRISEATRKMMRGDFTVRIQPIAKLPSGDKFQEIIDCINQMAEDLSGVETLRTDFIANVSHEMKTPLAVMQNYGTLLQEPGLDEEKRIEYAKAVTDASRRLSDMMTNILKLNRLENQQIYPNAQPYDLGEQLCESLLQYEVVWERRGIEIETDLAENVTVCADAELLSLVWNNLFSNAFKFTGEGGTVSVSLSVSGSYAVVRVKDSGCGMSPEVGAHIFEKFYQGDSSHATQGNGLGLALVKRVIDITGGEIAVESEVGRGSTFTVKLQRSFDNGLEKNLE
ncbi:MAG: HAMP domain-containing histidine kinase [Clostridia bacterium]|nr:HAMP domain-containing histidine kinase [Clostridia bacterium]